VGRVQYLTPENFLRQLSHARYAIRGATTLCRVMPISAVAARAAGMCEPEVEAGSRALNVVVSDSCGDAASLIF
jgi:hypothetical protein